MTRSGAGRNVGAARRSNPGAHKAGSLTIDPAALRTFARAGEALRANGIDGPSALTAAASAALVGLVGPRTAAALRVAVAEGIDEVLETVFPSDQTATGTALCHHCGRLQPEESFTNPQTGVRGAVCTPCRMSAITAARRHYQIPDDDPSHQPGPVTVVRATGTDEEEEMPTTNGHAAPAAVPVRTSRDDAVALAYLIVEADRKITEARAALEAAIRAREEAIDLLRAPRTEAPG